MKKCEGRRKIDCGWYPNMHFQRTVLHENCILYLHFSQTDQIEAVASVLMLEEQRRHYMVFNPTFGEEMRAV